MIENTLAPKISVIITVYNGEALLPKMLDTLLVQTFDDYEVLLIDDGSKDGSPAICDEYAAKNKRVDTYHKANGGLSDARNYGLVRAKGEYTIFFDQDDWVDAECLSRLYEKAKKEDADMVICDLFLNDQYIQKYFPQRPTSLDHMTVLHDISTGVIHGYTHNKLIKRDVYTKYGIEYPRDIYGNEDQYTMCCMLKHDIKVAYLPEAFYHYVFHSNSSVSRYYDDKTYNVGILTRKMFNDLLQDTPFAQQVYEGKSHAIVTHAFMYGGRQFSSKEFREKFKSYKDYVRGNEITDILVRLSIDGHFKVANKLYWFLFGLKQQYKKIRFIFNKK